MARNDLIRLLEAATGPDIKLDFQIASLCLGAGLNIEAQFMKDGVLPFTSYSEASLPGAENLFWTIEKHAEGMEVRWFALAKRDCRNFYAPGFVARSIGRGATEPLARRIAEIKALVRL